KQHAAGKLTARERLDILFDKDTFCELNDMMESRASDFGMDKKRVPGDGVVTGYGKVGGRTVFASSQDFTVNGGSLGEYQAKKICRVMDIAMDVKAPFVSINDSGGARIEEGIDSLSGYGDIFFRNTRASGVIPQISVIMGPCAGGACYSPAITDFVFMVRNTGLMFITGPQVVKSVTREEVSAEELGGAKMHAEQSGVVHFAYDDDASCLCGVRHLLSYLPQSAAGELPITESKPVDLCRGLQEVVSDNQKKCYDVKAVIGAMVDQHSLMEVHADFAKNAVIGFARLEGRTIGVVANQPNYMGGALDINASDKIARFVRFCNCFGIPLLTFVDVPGYLPGTAQEHAGIIRHGAKVLYAYSEATVPKVTVILRKAYGGAYIAMCSKGLGADAVYAWPIAQIAVMGAEGAVGIVGKKAIEAALDKSKEISRQITEYENKFLHPFVAVARGYVDEVILPEETRGKIVSTLEMLENKHKMRVGKNHGNMP
ncbi:MAG: acyl-CoA carboxylase subunit beta, partial [Raoultibacter sp.]